MRPASNLAHRLHLGAVPVGALCRSTSSNALPRASGERSDASSPRSTRSTRCRPAGDARGAVGWPGCRRRNSACSGRACSSSPGTAVPMMRDTSPSWTRRSRPCGPVGWPLLRHAVRRPAGVRGGDRAAVGSVQRPRRRLGDATNPGRRGCLLGLGRLRSGRASRHRVEAPPTRHRRSQPRIHGSPQPGRGRRR